MNYKNAFAKFKDAFCNTTATILKESLERQFDTLFSDEADKRLRPTIERVVLSASCSKKGQLIAYMELWLFYGTFLAVKNITITRKFNSADLQRFQSDMINYCPRLAKQFSSQAITNFPKKVEDNPRYFTKISVGPGRNKEYAGFWSTHQSLKDRWNDFWRSKSDTYSERVMQKTAAYVEANTSKYAGKENGAAMRLRQSNVEVSFDGLTVYVEISVGVSYGNENRIWRNFFRESMNLYLQDITGDSEKINKAIWHWMCAVADKCLSQLFQNAAFCLDAHFEEDIQKFQGIWFRVNRPKGPVRGRVSNMPNPQQCVGIRIDGDPKLIMSNPLTAKNAFNLDYEKYLSEQKHPYTLRRKELPDNIHSFATFIDLANVLYEKLPKKKLNAKPEIIFSMVDGKVIGFTYRKKAISIENFLNSLHTDKALTAYALLTAIFTDVISQEADLLERGGKIAYQLETLNLNAGELKILRYLCERGKSGYTDIAESINVFPQITNAAIGRYLEGLLSKTIEVDGAAKPLVWFEWVTSQKHDDFRMYHPADFLSVDILDMLTPRPVCIQDIPDMDKWSKEKWAVELARKASNEEDLWFALDVLRHMSAAFAAEFCKSRDGQKFFSKFKGDDAVYARFFVESLPGCKRVAAQIFSKEAN